jgi:hypothetical protein
LLRGTIPKPLYARVENPEFISGKIDTRFLTRHGFVSEKK